MRTYLYCEAGFVEKAQWLPNSWVNVVCPDSSDFKFLTETLKVPESFLNDIADTDERPRTETEGNWLLTILRIPVQNAQSSIPYTTVPIGIITNNEIIVSVCYHQTDMIPDFIEHTRRKGIEVRNKLDLIFRLIYSSAVWFPTMGNKPYPAAGRRHELTDHRCQQMCHARTGRHLHHHAPVSFPRFHQTCFHLYHQIHSLSRHAPTSRWQQEFRQDK